MSVAIRNFTFADYHAALRLWEATEGVGLSDADSPRAIQQFLARNPGLGFVASAGGELVGTILCGHDGRRGFIYHLAVHPAHRRRGLGRQLVRRGLAALHEQGIDKCHLFVFRENSQGVAFWHRIGGEERTTLTTFSFVTHALS